MTREELEWVIGVFECSIHSNFNDWLEAKELAIEALKAQPCGDCVSRKQALDAAKCIYQSNSEAKAFCMIKMLEELPSVTPAFSVSTDCVSREAALQQAKAAYHCAECMEELGNLYEENIKSLPSVTPERPNVDEVCKILSNALDAPCNHGLDGEEVCDIIPSEWCEDNCPNNEDYSICWKKYFEIKSADMRGEQK